MAFDFPNSPTPGQIVNGPGGTRYQWDATGAKWLVPQPDQYLPLVGGVMQGAITLAADATAPMQAVTLQQLQASAGGQVGPWQTMPLVAPWSPIGTPPGAVYRLIGDAQLEFSVLAQAATPIVYPASSVLGTLPVAFRPQTAERSIIQGGSSSLSIALVVIEAAGDVRVYTVISDAQVIVGTFVIPLNRPA